MSTYKTYEDLNADIESMGLSVKIVATLAGINVQSVYRWKKNGFPKQNTYIYRHFMRTWEFLKKAEPKRNPNQKISSAIINNYNCNAPIKK